MAAWDDVSAEAGGPCAYRYVRGGRLRAELACPDAPAFSVKLAGHPDRKARLACPEHLAAVIWAMQRDYALYEGSYELTAAPFQIS